MRKALIASLLALFSAIPALADDSHHKASAALTDGEVRKVDKDAKKITIRHAAIANLDMPAHTMVFQVRDPAMLEQVKPGDKVRFEAENVGGAFRLTRIERAN